MKIRFAIVALFFAVLSGHIAAVAAEQKSDRVRLIPIQRLPQTAFWRPTPPHPQSHLPLIPTIRRFGLIMQLKYRLCS
jgi:hypothetical protein